MRCPKCHYVASSPGLERCPACMSEWSSPSPKPGSREWLAERFKAYTEAIVAVRNDGQKEYAHDENNVFANFDRAGKALGVEREKVLMIFAQKHMDGIYAHLRGHTSQREDVRGRIKDLICYLMLLWGMIDES